MRLVVALVLGILLQSATAAGASAPPATAKAFFQAGAQAYDAGRYAAAVEAFEEAYRLSPLPAILFSMAQAERKQFYVGQQTLFLDRALVHYRAYVESKHATRLADAVDALAELESLAARRTSEAAGGKTEAPPGKARLMVTTQAAGATVAVDDAVPVEAPFIGELEPGKHRVRVAAEGFVPTEREVEVAPGPPVGLDLPLRELAGVLSVEAPSGTEVHLDGKLLGSVPFPGPVEVRSGPHVLTLTRRGLEPWTGEIQVERGKPMRVAPPMEQTPQRIGSQVVLGAGLVGLLTSGVTALAALNRQAVAQTVLDERASGNIGASRLADYNRALSQRDRWRTTAQVSASISGGLLMVGALMYLLDRSAIAFSSAPKQKGKELHPEPWPVDVTAGPVAAPGAIGLGMAGRF